MTPLQRLYAIFYHICTLLIVFLIITSPVTGLVALGWLLGAEPDDGRPPIHCVMTVNSHEVCGELLK
jgi:hypothetical protein